MKKYFIIIALLMGIAFIGLVGLSIYQLGQKEQLVVDESVAEGKLIWQQEGCMECHAIFGNGGYSASDLTKITAKREADWLHNYFSDPPIMPPSRAKQHPGLAPEEVDNIISFFRWVQELDTHGWPPDPRFQMEPNTN